MFENSTKALRVSGHAPPSSNRARLGPRSVNPAFTARGTMWNQLRDASWHPALWLTLAIILNILEGAVRKWLPGFGEGAARGIVYFSKDLVFIIGAVTIVSRRVVKRPALAPLTDWGILAIALILIGGLLSSLQDFSPVGSVLSLRALFLLPLAAWFFAKRTENFPLIGFALVVVALSFANASLSLTQGTLPRDHILNKYAAGEQEIVEVAHGVRATGTFAYITGLGILSSLGVWAGMVLLSLSRKWWGRIAGAIGILSGLACAFASISRGPMVVAGAMLAMWLFSSIKAIKILWRAISLSILTAGVVYVALPGLTERFINAAEGTIDRFSVGDSNMERAFGPLEEMWLAITNHPVGSGLGTEQIGGAIAATGRAIFKTYESQMPRIVAEFGLLGLLGYFMLVFLILQSLQRTKGPKLESWNLAVTATQVYLLGQFYSNVVFNHTGSAAVWIVAAAVFAAAPTSGRRAPRRTLRKKRKEAEPENEEKEVMHPGQP